MNKLFAWIAVAGCLTAPLSAHCASRPDQMAAPQPDKKAGAKRTIPAEPIPVLTIGAEASAKDGAPVPGAKANAKTTRKPMLKFNAKKQ